MFFSEGSRTLEEKARHRTAAPYSWYDGGKNGEGGRDIIPWTTGTEVVPRELDVEGDTPTKEVVSRNRINRFPPGSLASPDRFSRSLTHKKPRGSGQRRTTVERAAQG